MADENTIMEMMEENQKLTDENTRLYDQLLSEIQLRKDLEKEKQELFRQLLKNDPETAFLFDGPEADDTAENEEPEIRETGTQDLPEDPGQSHDKAVPA